jgi:hypothetical protein
MKGIQGLIIAVFLGLIGAGVNLAYLYKGRNTEEKHFVGIKQGVKLKRGETILHEHLERVSIPKAYAGNLEDYAYPYSKVNTVAGEKSSRGYNGELGELVMQQDLRTPHTRLKLKPNERAVSVTIDTRATVASQIIPGVTPVSFSLPTTRGAGTAPMAAQWEWFGPFDVLAVGNRMGQSDVLGARKVSAKQQNVLTLRVTVDESGQYDARFLDLFKFYRESNFNPLIVMIHPEDSATADD